MLKTFIYKFRYAVGIVLFATIIALIAAGVFAIDNSVNRMVVDYAQNLGWEIEDAPVEVVPVNIPREFDKVYEAYNRHLKTGGFDLEPFRGKSCTRYTYQVKNHQRSEDVPVYLGVIVYESRIVAAEVYSSGPDGFMHGICETEHIID
jgi:hypothetical protein